MQCTGTDIQACGMEGPTHDNQLPTFEDEHVHTHRPMQTYRRCKPSGMRDGSSTTKNTVETHVGCVSGIGKHRKCQKGFQTAKLQTLSTRGKNSPVPE